MNEPKIHKAQRATIVATDQNGETIGLLFSATDPRADYKLFAWLRKRGFSAEYSFYAVDCAVNAPFVLMNGQAEIRFEDM